MFDLKELSARLKQARVSQNITQRQLAKMTDMTAATISAYENGVKNPCIENISRLATALNISLDWLCGGEANNKSEFKTYADVMAAFADALSCIDFTFEDSASASLSIHATDELFAQFLSDFARMKSLLDSKNIDESIFKSWLDGQIQKYSKKELK